MPDGADDNTNKPGQTPAANSGGGTPAAATDLSSIQAKLAEMEAAQAKATARIHELNEENKKYRQRNDEETKKALEEKRLAEAKLKEQGEYVKLLDSAKAELAEKEQRLALLASKAERLDAIQKKQQAELDAAKAKGDLPGYVTRGIDAAMKAGDYDEAASILSDFRSQATKPVTPAQTPATPAPVPGATPPSPAARKPVEQMTEAELRALQADPKAWQEATGGGGPNGTAFNPVTWINSRYRTAP